MMRRAIIVALALLVVLVGTTILGFAQPAKPGPAPLTGGSRLAATTVLYDGLPAGLQLYLAQTVSRTPPVTTTALAWGIGRLRVDLVLFDIWLPVAWRKAMDAERGFVWRADVMWWGRRVVEIEERYVDGVGAMRVGDHAVQDPCMTRRQAMRSNAELVWLPSVLLDREKVRWRSRGRDGAIMLWRTADGVDSLAARFDRRTRALESLSGRRCFDGTERMPWSLEFTGWDAPGGLTVPVEGVASWDDEPYYRFRVDGIAYNVPVAAWLDAPPGGATHTDSR